MACDGGKGMLEMDKKEELLQQQPNQQQPQLPGAADPDPWPPPMRAGLVDESNSDWEMASIGFQVFVLGGRATAGSFVFGNVNRRKTRAIASRMKATGSEKALALVGPSTPSGVGGTRRLVGALPVCGEHVYAKRGDPHYYGCRDRKACTIRAKRVPNLHLGLAI